MGPPHLGWSNGSSLAAGKVKGHHQIPVIASTPLGSTSDITPPRQLHQTGAQAMAASIRSVFVTESSLSQALMAPANPWATNCAMT